MKSKLLFAIAAATLPLGGGLSVSANPAPPVRPLVSQQPTSANWQEFASNDGKFAVLMPGVPEADSKTDPNGNVNHSFMLALDEELYLINYFDFPEGFSADSAQVRELLDTLPNSFAQGASARLVGDRNITLDGHPGKEFQFALANEQAPPGIGRLYLVDRRIYLAIAMTPQSQKAQRFLESFRILS
ncbi:hypothetical protein H6G20_08555 [Desertifilum sp. FACHB-1129]|uniref:Uncharacterized protein n=1 Tax=Desertifilum tharense IPPAS B-1220 TaxID=1781255 RepID=A0A1E5QFU2_9CYAN|nr:MULTISPECIES: hypothetical protein [Cyanophyceae]MCD8486358.1 hypothetical protein [Desertifilum sp.]MDA0212416.1 hypothetical protein [Cyanobacteria bacterium FC1]MDI9641852.1 hypothetical protein [Geitlerinema splendidum]MBD2311707.1 hypothetical protein [Desertifilum sp. FACHB-1129]MBD2322768.1 hypothetical protein [Desertifilum sp. FACHB-866]